MNYKQSAETRIEGPAVTYDAMNHSDIVRITLEPRMHRLTHLEEKLCHHSDETSSETGLSLMQCIG